MTDSLFEPDIDSLRRATPWVRRVVKYWNDSATNRAGVYSRRAPSSGFTFLSVIPLLDVGLRLPSALQGFATGIPEPVPDWAAWTRNVLGFSAFGGNAGRAFHDFLELLGAPESLVGAWRRCVFPRPATELGENRDDIVGRGGLADYLSELQESGKLRLLQSVQVSNCFVGSARNDGDIQARIDLIFTDFRYEALPSIEGFLEGIAEKPEIHIRFREFTDFNPELGTFTVKTSRYRLKKPCCFC
jgi:hypothetical protein